MFGFAVEFRRRPKAEASHPHSKRWREVSNAESCGSGGRWQQRPRLRTFETWAAGLRFCEIGRIQIFKERNLCSINYSFIQYILFRCKRESGPYRKAQPNGTNRTNPGADSDSGSSSVYFFVLESTRMAVMDMDL